MIFKVRTPHGEDGYVVEWFTHGDKSIERFDVNYFTKDSTNVVNADETIGNTAETIGNVEETKTETE